MRAAAEPLPDDPDDHRDDDIEVTRIPDSSWTRPHNHKTWSSTRYRLRDDLHEAQSHDDDTSATP